MDRNELTTKYMDLRATLACAYAAPDWDSAYIDSLTDEIAGTEAALAAAGGSDAICYPTHAESGTAVALAYHEEGTSMNHTNLPAGSDTPEVSTPRSTVAADDWQRRFGVPWQHVERAVKAVSDRAVAASQRKFADLNNDSAEASPV